MDSDIKEREGKTENSVEEDDNGSLKNMVAMPNSYREQADILPQDIYEEIKEQDHRSGIDLNFAEHGDRGSSISKSKSSAAAK